jgi:dTDP-4-dehydrorhamnose reductase
MSSSMQAAFYRFRLEGTNRGQPGAERTDAGESRYDGGPTEAGRAMGKRRWLVTGAAGQLGGYLLRQLQGEVDSSDVLALTRAGSDLAGNVRAARVDLGDGDAVRRIVAEFRPDYVLHVGAMTSVADCYAQPAVARRVNVTATRVLAEATVACGGRLVYSSTDMVFAGNSAPYGESDPPGPLSHYGRTKLAAEQELADFDRALTVRLPLMYGFACTRRETTFAKQIAALRSRRPLRLFADEVRTPVWLADAARALVGLARSDLAGVIHVAGPERLSRLEMVEQWARLLGVADAKLEPVSRLSIDAAEPRPEDLSLDGSRLAGLFPGLVPGPMRAKVFAERPESGDGRPSC